MSTQSVLKLLEAEVNGHPEEKDGTGLYGHLRDLAQCISAKDREGLIGALGILLRRRPTVPYFVLIIDLAGELKLRELRNTLEKYRQEILAGLHSPPGKEVLLWAVDKALTTMS